MERRNNNLSEPRRNRTVTTTFKWQRGHKKYKRVNYYEKEDLQKVLS